MKTARLAVLAGCLFVFANCGNDTEGNPAGQSIEDKNDARTDMNDDTYDNNGEMNDMDTMDMKDYPGDSL